MSEPQIDADEHGSGWFLIFRISNRRRRCSHDSRERELAGQHPTHALLDLQDLLAAGNLSSFQISLTPNRSRTFGSQSRPAGRPRGRPQLDSLKVRFKIRPAFAAPTSWARRLQQHNRLWPQPQVLRVASPMENPGMWCGRLGSSRFKRGFLRVHLSVRPPLPEVCGGRFHLHCLNSGSQGIGMHGCACRNSRFPLAENLSARIVRAQFSVRCCAVFIFTEGIPVEWFRSCRVPVLSMFPQSTSVSR